MFRTAVPFCGQTTWNLSVSSPERDCGPRQARALYGMQHLTVSEGVFCHPTVHPGAFVFFSRKAFGER